VYIHKHIMQLRAGRKFCRKISMYNGAVSKMQVVIKVDILDILYY
jgi:hypothetical protein